MATAAKRALPKPRLSAEERRTQIMDSATELILSRGLIHCTLEEVALAAGISKALIYRHFSNRDELLTALLEREFSVLRGRGLGAFPPDTPFDRVVRAATQQAFDYLYERGAILRELFSDRSSVQLLQERDREERMQSTRFFVEKSIRTYRLPPDVAQIIAIITINAPATAARGLRRFGFSPQKSADVWSEFVLGGWAAVAERFGENPPVADAVSHTANTKPPRRSSPKR
ncbi:MAG: TetR/AcrR family transcriptional regulator [Cytophagales bacterium]|nr:TetR/AcrR family transcriptional regulator [Rhizobacter sp.]